MALQVCTQCLVASCSDQPLFNVYGCNVCVCIVATAGPTDERSERGGGDFLEGASPELCRFAADTKFYASMFSHQTSWDRKYHN